MALHPNTRFEIRPFGPNAELHPEQATAWRVVAVHYGAVIAGDHTVTGIVPLTRITSRAKAERQLANFIKAAGKR